MNNIKTIQNYQNAMAYERFMKTAYSCTQRDSKRGISSSEFHLLYHIEIGYSHGGISYASQLKRVQRFVLEAMKYVEVTRSIPKNIRPAWESLKLDVAYSTEADNLFEIIMDIRNVISVDLLSSYS